MLAAPAGAGKSAALSAWITKRANRVAWLSLDETDSDRHRFWALALDAMRLAGVGAPVADLEVHPWEPADMIAPELLNALERLDGPITLVLEDLHRISAPEIYADLAQLLSHPSTRLRLVVSTRFDPPVGIERMRLAGQVAELRASDLAFTLEEAVDLFELLGLSVARPQMETLWLRCEGWAAALRLAATTLEGRDDPERLVAELAGDDVNIADYLMAEVLAREPDDIREFLLRVSVVDELPVELATELTGRQDSADILEGLSHRNALVAPLGGRRDVYHLHTLFGQLLRARLRYERPEEIAPLHARTALWYARAGAPVAALRHALEGDDAELAAELTRDRWIEALATGELGALRPLIGALPGARVEKDPELALALAASLIASGRDTGVDGLLRRAEERADEVAPERQERFSVARAIVLLHRGSSRGDLASANDAAERLLSDVSVEAADDAIRALALAELGVVQLWSGSIDSGMRSLERALGLAGAAGLDWMQLLCNAYLALGSARQGRLSACERRAVSTLELATRRGWTRSQPAGVALIALAGVHYQWNQLEQAERALKQADVSLRSAQSPPVLAHHGFVWGRVLAAQGRLGEALEAYDVALDKLVGWPAMDDLRYTLVLEIALTRAALGERYEAEQALTRAAAEAPAPALGLAQLALADDRATDAREHVAMALRRDEMLLPSQLVDAWALDAIACDALNDHAAAQQSLERALEAAEPAGFRQALISHGESIRPLLRRQLHVGTSHRALVEQLLTGLDGSTPRRSPSAVLGERLSDREAAVLRFLPTMMSNQEIAAELFVSVNTVKTHLRSIYRKLDASDRRQAVRRARELELLSP